MGYHHEKRGVSSLFVQDAHKRRWGMQDPSDNLHGYVPQGLQNLLESDVIKLGIGIRQDFEKLEDHYPYVTPQNYVDLAVVAAAYGMSEGGLEAM